MIAEIRYKLRATKLRLPLVLTRHYGIQPEDVFIASYPKSGNTWLKLMLGQLFTGDELDFDSVEELVPMVGKHRKARSVLRNGGRLIKTHEPYLPAYHKAIYLVRDGRDVAISYYYHQLRQSLFQGSFHDFFNLFLQGKADGYGKWRDHVSSWLDCPLNKSNRMTIIRYEEARQNPIETLKKITVFLDLPISEAKIKHAIEMNSLERMRNKEKESRVALSFKRKDIPFVRKGAIGEWKDVLSPDENERFYYENEDILIRLGYEK